MATKDEKAVVLRVDPEFFDYLNKYCEEVGQTKKVAMTRILKNYLDDYFAEDKKTRIPL